MARFSLVKFLAVAIALVCFVTVFHMLVSTSVFSDVSQYTSSRVLGLGSAVPVEELMLEKEAALEKAKAQHTSQTPEEQALEHQEGDGGYRGAKGAPGAQDTLEKTSKAVEAEPYHYTDGADFYMSQLVDAEGKVKAAFVTLARNSELYELVKAIRSVEDRFNKKFKYDWIFLNEEDFTQEFIDLTTALVSGKTKYGKIPKEHWLYPEWIDEKKAQESRDKMALDGIIYGGLESYRHMCRFESGFFWQNELLADYEWYWRVEPGIQVNCDIDYDVFKHMQDNRKVYGMVITIHEYEATIPTLWETTTKFLNENPQYISKNNAMKFLSNDKGKKYNMCHFWSNFEIANLNFWRSKAYHEYFDYLDKAGGFFYERWGDAPVHSIAASLFLTKDKVHFFDDIGYWHNPYSTCPLDADTRYKLKCSCNPQDDFTFRGYSCGKLFHDVFEIEKPTNWEQFT